MEQIITKSSTMEKIMVLSKDEQERYELTFHCNNNQKKEKKILVISLNPTFHDLTKTDVTTMYILNNLLPMGFTTITISNLFSKLCTKLTCKSMDDNESNLEYIKELLKKDYHTVLIGYGNTLSGNKKVNNEKQELEMILKEAKANVVELVDEDDIYSRLTTIHPLFAGQRFSGKWKFRKYIFDLEVKKSTTNKKTNDIQAIKKSDKDDSDVTTNTKFLPETENLPEELKGDKAQEK